MTTPQAYLMHKLQYDLQLLAKHHNSQEIERLIKQREERTGQKLVAKMNPSVLGSKRIRAKSAKL